MYGVSSWSTKVRFDALTRPGMDPVPSITRVHVCVGRRGASEIASPGALMSIGIRPVATSTWSQLSTPGSRSGEPLPSLLLMSTPSRRKTVCVHELPRAPRRAALPVLRPPVSTRSLMTSGITVSISESRLPPLGRSLRARW
jgi:hypothetical protein